MKIEQLLTDYILLYRTRYKSGDWSEAEPRHEYDMLRLSEIAQRELDMEHDEEVIRRERVWCRRNHLFIDNEMPSSIDYEEKIDTFILKGETGLAAYTL